MGTSGPSQAVLINSSRQIDRVHSKVRPPNLQDPTRYVKVDRVPIIDTCERTYFKTDSRTGQHIKVEESIDKTQLQKILENSRHRAQEKELSPVFIGHTTDDGSELDQPPIVGYLDNYQLGEHEGRSAILADLYLDKEDCDPSKTLRQFPRRSAEIIGIAKPTGYIDSVALLKRTPERPLGLVTSHYKKESTDIYRFECPGCEKKQMSMASQYAEHEAKQNKVKGKKDVFKSALKLVELMGNSLFEDEASPSEPSDEETDLLEDEPSMPETKVSRHARMSSSSSSSSGELEDDAEPSEDSSSDDPSHPAGKNRRKEMKEPSRMDPEPSRMHKKTDKSKMMEGGGGSAGFAGPTTSPPVMEKNEPSKMSTKSKVSRKSKDDSERTRIRNDEDRIHVSRFQKALDQSAKREQNLIARLDAIDAEKRSAVIEQKLTQLQGEGYELDRVNELSRFKKYFSTDDEVDEEITRMRSAYRQSPVGQSLIPSFSADLGGSSVERPRTIQELMEPLPEEYDRRGKPFHSNEYAPIIGSHIARMAKKEGLIPSRDPEANFKRGQQVDYGLNAISRFQASKSDKTRMS